MHSFNSTIIANFWNGKEVEFIAGASQPFLADINNTDAMLYYEDVGPITFFGLNKNGGPKISMVSKKLTTLDWQKVYKDLSCPITSSCGKPS